MNIYPAIDLRGGNCVRLVKGDFSKETIYSNNPGEMAAKWATAPRSITSCGLVEASMAYPV